MLIAPVPEPAPIPTNAWHISSDDFELKTDEKYIIGEGTFARVYRAKMRVKGKDARERVALKILKGLVVRNAQAVAQFGREVGVIWSFKHPNICRAYGGWLTIDKNANIYPTLVLELLPGNLKNLLWPGDDMDEWQQTWQRTVPKLTDDHMLSILRQLAEVLAFLHNRYPQILHCDIKAENILLTFVNEQFIPKLCDFGVAKEIRGSLRMTFAKTDTGLRGTAAYIVCLSFFWI